MLAIEARTVQRKVMIQRTWRNRLRREMEAWRSTIPPPVPLTEGVTSFVTWWRAKCQEWKSVQRGQWNSRAATRHAAANAIFAAPQKQQQQQQQQRAPSDQPSQRKFAGGRGGRVSSATPPGRSGARRANPKPPKAPPPSAIMIMYRVAF